MAYRTPESSLADKCLAWLKKRKEEGAPLYWEHRSGSGGFNYKEGVPDLFVVANGRHLEIELKAPKGKLSAMQEKFRYRCWKEWNIPHLVPKDIETFASFVESFLP